MDGDCIGSCGDVVELKAGSREQGAGGNEIKEQRYWRVHPRLGFIPEAPLLSIVNKLSSFLE